MKKRKFAVKSEHGLWNGVGWTTNKKQAQWWDGFGETKAKALRLKDDFGQCEVVFRVD